MRRLDWILERKGVAELVRQKGPHSPPIASREAVDCPGTQAAVPAQGRYGFVAVALRGIQANIVVGPEGIPAERGYGHVMRVPAATRSSPARRGCP
jgi:hypothetical protein